MKKKKERRVDLPRVLGSGQVMMPADLRRTSLRSNLIASRDRPFFGILGFYYRGTTGHELVLAVLA